MHVTVTRLKTLSRGPRSTLPPATPLASNPAHLLPGSPLPTLGWTDPIRIVPNGKEVIKYLSGEGKYSDREAWPFPSVMFLDIKMPQTDGFLRWMGDHPKCSVLPTMMFSTPDDERDVQLAYDLGANAYSVKPALVSELKAIWQTAYEFWARRVKPKARSGR
jgi:CheY-like chemotaxis protein